MKQSLPIYWNIKCSLFFSTTNFIFGAVIASALSPPLVCPLVIQGVLCRLAQIGRNLRDVGLRLSLALSLSLPVLLWSISRYSITYLICLCMVFTSGDNKQNAPTKEALIISSGTFRNYCSRLHSFCLPTTEFSELFMLQLFFCNVLNEKNTCPISSCSPNTGTTFTWVGLLHW